MVEIKANGDIFCDDQLKLTCNQGTVMEFNCKTYNQKYWKKAKNSHFLPETVHILPTTSTKFWVKEKDVRNISTDDNDYVLSGYLEKLQHITVEEDKIELVDDIRDNDDFLKSPFYAKIISLIDEDDELAEEIEIDENSNEEMILDSIDLGDDF